MTETATTIPLSTADNDPYYNRRLTARPLIGGHVDKRFFSAVLEDYVYIGLKGDLIKVLDTIEPTDALRGTARAESYMQAIVQRDGARAWRWQQPSTDLPLWAVRAISEIVCDDPDLRIHPDPEAPCDRSRAILYRRVLPNHMVSHAPARWAPVGNLKTTYRGGRRDDIPGFEDVVKDALLMAGQTIRRGCEFLCSNGSIRIEYRPEEEHWYETRVIDGVATSYEGADSYASRIDPAFTPLNALGQLAEPLAYDRPMTYTVETNTTVEDATSLARDASVLLRNWTDPAGGGAWWNIQRMFAGMFLRSHPEIAFVLQGPGGTGKSTLAKDLKNHLGDQAMTLSLDLLSQPTALSAENAMGELTSHLMALTDDYDPRHGRFDRINANLKSLLTGMLPFSARRQGENATHGTPQAMHVITTNYHLPIGEGEHEQRRFAFTTVTDPTHANYAAYRKFTKQHGFWPFMLASAHAWSQVGDKQYRNTSWISMDELTDADMDAVHEVLETGFAYPNPQRRVSWKKLGLKRTSYRDGGRTRVRYRPWREDENTALHGVWEAILNQVTAAEQAAARPAPIPDKPVAATVQEWADDLKEAQPCLFPCKGSGDKAKSPDTGLLDLIAGTTSWQKATRDPALADKLSRPALDDHDCWGMTVSDRYVWLDLDCHADRENGWERLNREVGHYGDPALPRTFMVRTPSGGVHLLYRIPDGLTLKSRANADTQVDLRVGGAGYVVAGGSTTDAGSYTPVDRPDDGIAPVMPGALAAWLDDHGYVDHKDEKQPAASHRERGHAAPSDGQPDMTAIRKGERNSTLNAWGYGRHQHYPDECARIDRDMHERGRASGLDDREVDGIIASIHRSLHLG